jgi:hypothetical protein
LRGSALYSHFDGNAKVNYNKRGRAALTREGWVRNPANVLQSEVGVAGLHEWRQHGSLEALGKVATDVRNMPEAPPTQDNACLLVLDGSSGNGAISDGTAMADFLGMLDYTSYFVIGVTGAEFKHWLSEFIGKTRNILVVYFSGKSGDGYLELAEGEQFTTAAAAEHLQSVLKPRSSKVIFLSECPSSSGLFDLNAGREQLPAGLLSFCACRPGQTLSVGDVSGVFTFALLDVAKDQLLSPQEVRPLVDEQVRKVLGEEDANPQQCMYEGTARQLFKCPVFTEAFGAEQRLVTPEEVEYHVVGDAFVVDYIPTLSRVVVQPWCEKARVVELLEVAQTEGAVFAKFSELEKFDGTPTLLTSLPEQDGLGYFEGATKLVDVSLPRLLTSVSSRMFAGCAALKRIALGAHVTTLEGFAFCHSGIEEADLVNVTTLE